MNKQEDFGVPSAASDAVIHAQHPSPDADGPCATCAFRMGTESNQSPHTMILARLCVEGIREFRCHEQPRLCRGWIAAVNVNGVPENEEAKRWRTACGFAADVYGDAVLAGVKADRDAAVTHDRP